MTELEKIEYTKSFIDDLANGINPLDGTPVPDGELLNNVRISRCMFYVSDILRQVVENSEGKNKKRPTEMGESLGISEEKRSGMYGDYIVVVYNLEAQQFVIDNLSSVIALKNK